MSVVGSFARCRDVRPQSKMGTRLVIGESTANQFAHDGPAKMDPMNSDMAWRRVGAARPVRACAMDRVSSPAPEKACFYLNSELYGLRTLASSGRDWLMMIYQEKIAPPLAPLTDDEQMKLRLEAIETEDRWVTDFIARLTGAVRDMKH
jgi:hypothetical protein